MSAFSFLSFPISTPHRLAGSILATTLAILATVLALEHIAGLAPCPLCLWQRAPYGGAAVLALLAFVTARPRVLPWLFAMMALVFVAAAGLGLYHLGIEQEWWPGPASCGGTGNATTIAELRRQLASTTPCDRPAATLGGLSLAAYNVIAAFFLAAAALQGLIRSRAPYSEDRP